MAISDVDYSVLVVCECLAMIDVFGDMVVVIIHRSHFGHVCFGAVVRVVRRRVRRQVTLDLRL